nr:hypothetical protein Iba_chr10fCG11170 [Ipomoea batatas]
MPFASGDVPGRNIRNCLMFPAACLPAFGYCDGEGSVQPSGNLFIAPYDRRYSRVTYNNAGSSAQAIRLPLLRAPVLFSTIETHTSSRFLCLVSGEADLKDLGKENLDEDTNCSQTCSGDPNENAVVQKLRTESNNGGQNQQESRKPHQHCINRNGFLTRQ